MRQMPSAVKSVRAMLLVIGAGNVVAALWFMVAAATLETGAMGHLVVGLLFLTAIPFGTLAVISIVLAAQFTNGGNRVRIGAVVVGSLIAAGSAVSVPAHDGMWGVGVAAGVLVAVLSIRGEARDWFDRPRQ
ncbi:hypothetical protein [Streptomyces sp. NPDC051219]|uniref:hypothetical protein n=1 Tax=Streptomyces sp. NPDC051219 TaxID=3155283 RepID=UPI003441D62F